MFKENNLRYYYDLIPNLEELNKKYELDYIENLIIDITQKSVEDLPF
jgi:hypothetical protein